LPLAIDYVKRLHGKTEKVMMNVENNRNVYTHSMIANHCSDNGCPIYLNGEYIYRDSDHIRRNVSIDMKHKMIDSFGIRKAINWQTYASE
jgi:hypothetical protein